MSHLSYRPEIDGLRAVSVLAVLLFHAGLGCPGGYVGVDVFFVISGYLITSVIVKDLAGDRFRFADFWERRIRRILPAMTAMVVVALIVGACLLLPKDLESLAKSAMAQAAIAANFYFLENTDYFDGPADLKPLLHTWSLAVEEQFYLIFPFLMFGIRKWNAARQTALLVVLTFASFALSVWGTYAFAEETYFLLPTRAWEMLAGALLAVAAVPQWQRAWKNELASAVGLALILWPVFAYHSSTRFPGAAAVPPCLGAVLIIHANSGSRTRIGRMLAWRPIVWVGLISYSLYLWHWPILAYLRYSLGEELTLSVRWLAVAVSVFCAVLSWKWIETPFRKRGSVRWPVFVSGIAATACIALAALSLDLLDGAPERFSPEVIRLVEDNEIPRRFQKNGQTLVGAPGDPVFMIWGDSHAQMLGDVIDNLAKEQGISGVVAARGATAPLIGTWRPNKGKAAVEWNQSVLDAILAKRIPHVVLISSWAVNVEGRLNGETQSLLVDDECHEVSHDAAKAVFQRALRRTVQPLRDAGVQVWIVTQVPEQAEDMSLRLARDLLFSWDGEPEGATISQYSARQAKVNGAFAELQVDGVRVVDAAALCFDADSHSRIAGEGRSYYFDDNHLSPYGAQQLVRPVLEPVFKEMTASLRRTAEHLPSNSEMGNRIPSLRR